MCLTKLLFYSHLTTEKRLNILLNSDHRTVSRDQIENNELPSRTVARSGFDILYNIVFVIVFKYIHTVS